MRTVITQQPPALPIWMSAAIWLAALLSPTVYFLLLMLADRWAMPAPPDGLIVALFCLIPVAALLVCGSVAWRSKLDLRWRAGWLVLTVLAMLLQFGVLLVIIVTAIATAIAPVQ